MNFTAEGKNYIINSAENFDLALTLDCGQAFRWSEQNGVWSGIVSGRLCRLSQSGDKIIIYDCDERLFDGFYRDYFDLDRDYGEVVRAVSQNETLKAAAALGGGIRILKQDPWETVCSFIISQNNNIPRIKGIIERLCENFGERIEGGFAFPSAEKIASLPAGALSIIRCGFREKYILDAARRFASGEISAERLSSLSTDDARAELMKIYGVGNKVADCVLLFSLSRIDAFPADVWIKRAMAELFGGSLPECAVPYAGIAQQYIFYYARTTRLKI